MTAEQACVTSETARPKTMPSFCSTVPQVFRQLEKFLELYPQDRHSLLCKQRRQDIQQKQHHNIHNPSYAFKEKDLWKFIEKEQSFFLPDCLWKVEKHALM